MYRCFGLFDGPKGPESTPVYGSLRTRPTSVLARRFNAEAYRTLPIEGAALVAPGGSSQKPAAAGQRTLENCMRSGSTKQAVRADDHQPGELSTIVGGETLSIEIFAVWLHSSLCMRSATTLWPRACP